MQVDSSVKAMLKSRYSLMKTNKLSNRDTCDCKRFFTSKRRSFSY